MNKNQQNQLFRNTAQKRVIVETLKGLKTHPTADELFAIVRKKLPKISLATVYRNLESLSAAGEIKKLEFGGHRRFDGCTEKHLHARCVKCGKIEDLMLEIPLSIENVAAWCGFEIMGANLEFFGFCPACKDDK